MHRFWATILYGVLYFFSLMPLRLHYLLSDIISFFLKNIVRYRRKVIYENISKCFPNEDPGNYKIIANEFYKYISDVFVEAIWQISASDTDVCKVVRQEGDKLVDDLCAKYDKVLIVTGHSGNWELVSAMCGENNSRTPTKFSSHSVYLGYKKLESEISDMLFKKIRQSLYKKFRNTGSMVESHSIIRNIIAGKGAKDIYVMIADQSPLPGKRVVAKFLGRPTLMMSGPEYIATKLNIPVVYLGMNREKRGRYLIHYDMISEYPAKENEFFVTREFARLLERDIKNNKYNWLWSHKRWKRELTDKEWKEYALLK